MTRTKEQRASKSLVIRALIAGVICDGIFAGAGATSRGSNRASLRASPERASNTF